MESLQYLRDVLSLIDEERLPPEQAEELQCLREERKRIQMRIARIGWVPPVWGAFGTDFAAEWVAANANNRPYLTYNPGGPPPIRL
jgi:hypothetical protein